MTGQMTIGIVVFAIGVGGGPCVLLTERFEIRTRPSDAPRGDLQTMMLGSAMRGDAGVGDAGGSF